jgi:hypothetical protein
MMAAQSRVVEGALAVAAAMVVLGLLASAAGAFVYVDSLTHHRFGLVPAPAGRLSAVQSPVAGTNAGSGASSSVCTVFGADTCSALVYHGGPVQHGEQDYLFLWAPSSYDSTQLTTYETGMSRWLDDVAAADYSASSPISVAQQYYDTSQGSKQFIPFTVQNEGVLVDTNPYPTSGGCSVSGYSVCLTESQLASELSNYISANSLPRGLDVEYFILTPNGVDTCTDSSSAECAYGAYCGYHTYIPGTPPILFADLPWDYETGCDVGSPAVLDAGYANSDYIDSTVSVFSHELSETMTDPELNAWYGVDGGSDEIGDKCAYNYGGPAGTGDLSGLSTDSNGGYYNVELGGDDYLLQLEYDNHTSDCQLGDTYRQPSASISVPSEVDNGSPATFALTNVSDPAGIAYVNWSFGDGGTTTSTGTAPVQHTYLTGPGSEQLTAVVTDNDGNELKLTTTVTVVLPVPEILSAPTITGTAVPGDMLTEAHGSWSESPTGYSYKWQDCDPSGSSCATISAAASQTYTVSSTDLGDTIRVQEIASNDNGPSVPASSAITAVVVDSPPASSAAPTISGIASEGQTLAEAHGTWSSFPTAYTYHWEDCDRSGASCSAIPGATRQTYTLAAADVGHTIRVEETAANAVGSSAAAAASEATAVVLPLPPNVSSAPTILGTAQQGHTLTETHASWTRNPTAYTYQWERCDSAGSGCVAIGGATKQTYALTAADVAHALRVQEGASNAGGKGPVASSAPTAQVLPALPAPASAPAIAGTPAQGSTLTESHGIWSNLPTSYAYEWERCNSSGAGCRAIASATHQTYALAAADVGHTIRVLEAAANAAGQAGPVSSSATAMVQPGSAAIARLFSSLMAAEASRLLGGKLAFDAPSAGALRISWREATGAHALVVRGTTQAASPGRTIVRLRFARLGRSLLRHARRLRLRVTVTFTPAGGTAVSAARKLTLKR